VSTRALVPINTPALASAPTLPTLRAGDLYYDTTNGLQVYSGTSWSTVGGSIPLSAVDGGVSDSIAPYAGGRASQTATQTVNGGSA
jgi:hypothetical protein